MADLLREVAERVYAREFNDSTCVFREGEGERAPRFLLTPTAARCNRLFVVGTLTEKEDIGTDFEFWRGRVVDPTGGFTIFAGQYQERAMERLASIEVPKWVAVIGKPSVREREVNGITTIYTSLRPEYLEPVDATTRDLWVIDTARATLERIKRMKYPGDLDEKTLRDIERAKDHYQFIDLEYYREMVLEALRSLRPRGPGVDTIDLSRI
ncbi:MAG TPA: DNA-binding protein [Candidatus Syntrophoarchaeum butanivorans]|uniref:DNA-binding protein n=1 Tax=Candidatus Syntropharchaeum butanivorans TaxID=1839936 RepID=A0A1F2P639_9EURY|nr:MAG: hypothetical protein SBU_000562 [Candidatus Syntrophoarchaeum butanivorans]RJS73613.1 MAG: DNA-binding protein [Candidatus Syntrophoarchaeum sp. WYZ-LMO15]HDM36306.1 DNA-binding protein [Candidatus Syntrophoarchaeum butanivorans]HEC57377.1 DNA-binding protein [Candidatus Syntrophoarchaeum butanivorans]